jgi:hypothetical protein
VADRFSQGGGGVILDELRATPSAYGAARTAKPETRVGTLRRMLELHSVNAVLAIAANILAFGWGLVYVRRGRPPGRLYAHSLALAQALLIAQVALGLLLLSDGRRSVDELHYLYGALALLVALSPWIYAPPVPSRRLLWFAGASLVASALAVRAYTTSG